MKEGNEMEHMVKVVDTFTGIVIAYLDQDAFDRAEATVAHVAAQVGKLYGCDEVEVYFPKGYKYAETVRIK
jgi:hypothetical protein